ncbi:MAG: hypothetical protein ACKOCM_09240 [Cyanobacteriota bacterium]
MNETTTAAEARIRHQEGETPTEPILCRHCGRTASNGISCEGSCVADSGY